MSLGINILYPLFENEDINITKLIITTPVLIIAEFIFQSFSKKKHIDKQL